MRRSIVNLADFLFKVVGFLSGAHHELTVQPLHALQGRLSFGRRELHRPRRLEAGSLEQALPLLAGVLPPPLPTISAREVELGGHHCQRHPQPQEKCRRRRPQPKLMEKYSSSGE